jgi:hypothetical protein
VFIGYALVTLGRNLVARGLHAEAERVLRESVEIRTRHHREGSWNLDEAKGLLGAALAGLGRHAEAEPLLLEAAEGDRLPTKGRLDRRREPIDALVRLYDGQGKPAQADARRGRLVEG